MDWNTKPTENAALSSYLESQSHFLRKALNPHTLAPQSSCNYSGNGQEVFVCPNNKSATLQSLQYQNIESHSSLQPASHRERSSRALAVAPSQADQSSHRPFGVPRNAWLSSSTNDSMFFNRGLSGAPSQASLSASVHNTLKSQDQYVSNTYTMHLQMLSSNSSKVPALYPGNQGTHVYSAEQQIAWGPPCAPNGLTVPFHQPSQYLDSQRGVAANIPDSSVQKQPAGSAAPLQVTNIQVLNPAVAAASAPPPYQGGETHHYAAISTVTETSNRNLPNYYCRVMPPFPKNAQYLAQNPPNEVLHAQQAHLSETKRGFGRDCQPQWQNTNENSHLIGSSCSQKPNAEANHPFCEAVNSFAVGGLPHYKNKPVRTNVCDASSELLSTMPAPGNQKNRPSLGEGSGFLGESNGSLRESSSSFVDGSGSHSSQPVHSEMEKSKENDSTIIKEGLFRDIKKLLAMKNEFLKLAKEIKIKKTFLSGNQDKTRNSLLQNTGTPLQLPSKDQSFPQLIAMKSTHQPLTAMQSVEDTNKTNTLNTSIKEYDCNRQIGNSVFPNSASSGKLQTEHMNTFFQETPPVCQKTMSALNPAQLPSSQIAIDVNKGDRFEGPQQLSSDTMKISLAQQSKNTLKKKENHKLLTHLLTSDNTTLDFTTKVMNQETSVKGTSEKMEDFNKSIHSEVKLKMDVASTQSHLKNTAIPGTTSTNGDGFDNSVKPKDRTSIFLNGISDTKDNNYSMEELAACLALWKKAPSESTNVQKCDKLGKNKTSDGMSSSTAIRNTNEPILPTASVPIGHKHESGNLNLTKGIELQIAVVSPLILSEVKSSDNQPLKPTKSSSESIFPVIQEGSVCSLQDQIQGKKEVASSDVYTAKGTVGISVATQNFPLTNKLNSKLKDIKSADGIVHSNVKLNFSSETTKENVGRSESHPSHLKKDTSPRSSDSSQHQKGFEQDKDQKISEQLVDDTPMSDDLLHIASVCSLVEGDEFYNSQIASMFNSVPLTQVDKKEVSPPDKTLIESHQLKEQLNQPKYESVGDLKVKNLLKIENGLPKTSDGTQSLETSKSFQLKLGEKDNGSVKPKNDVEPKIEKTEVASKACCSSTNGQKYPNAKEIAAVSSTQFAKEPPSCMVQNIEQANNRIIFDAVSVKLLNDQLSELVEEFPYGIESRDTYSIIASENKNSSLQQTTNPVTKDKETTIKSNCDSEDPINQIKITILSSERMKELFPKENEDTCEKDENLDKLKKSRKKETVTDIEDHCGSRVKTIGDNGTPDSIIPSIGKDNIHCCTLGWLSTVYDGVPKCHCDSRRGIKKDDTIDGQSKGDPATGGNIISANNLQNLVAYSEGKRSLLEMEQDEIKCSPKTFEKEKPGFSSKRKMMKHNERDSQENPQKILKARNLIPLHGEKKKPRFWSMKNKELFKKERPSRDLVSTEKLKQKFKSSCSKFKNPKQKLEQMNTSNMEHKKKYELEQKTGIVNGSKFCESLSGKNEENCHVDKTSTDAKSTHLEKSGHQSVMNTSNVNLNSSKSYESPSKMNKKLSSQDYLQRKKKKEKISKGDLKQRHENEKLKKNRPHVSDCVWRNKLTIKLVNCAKSNEGHDVRKYKRSLDNLAHHNKATKSHRSKIHHSKESQRGGIARNVQEKVGEKPSDNKAILNKKVNKYNQMPLQGRDQREQKKMYLNRVAFKRTAQESICLTKLECSPGRSVNQGKHDNDGNKTNQDSFALEREKFEKPRMLEFKLCPEGLLKNGKKEEHLDFKSFTKKEQVPVQGIKSTKEDWLKCIPQKKRKVEAVKDKDDSAPSSSRAYKRAFSDGGFKAAENSSRDSTTMFQTYKKLYLEKRSRSVDAACPK
ncbi:retroelement silencing factor 1 isoform X1 [Monodelphis domestica]|uniref:Retroelement silencing factor 1 n=1 Tax=Monodelphis domestica TaxID=13616 RepID=F6UYM6_MONDO|nr:retroelement silencing factor 1 isoform X1 [Monodelphis domestica]